MVKLTIAIHYLFAIVSLQHCKKKSITIYKTIVNKSTIWNSYHTTCNESLSGTLVIVYLTVSSRPSICNDSRAVVDGPLLNNIFNNNL